MKNQKIQSQVKFFGERISKNREFDVTREDKDAVEK